MNNWTGKRWNRDQLVFMVEAVLIGVIDRLHLPDENSENEGMRGDISLNSYENGALEGAGMTLGVMYAHITDDGLGIYDALQVAGKFDDAIRQLVATAWVDKGQKIHAFMKELQGKSYRLVDDLWEVVYPGLYPDAHKHAVAFVDECFRDHYEN